MGWGKFNEDIVSRYVSDTAMHSPSTEKPTGQAPIKDRTEKLGVKPVSGLKKFAVATPRPLPVIVLADVSASMSVDGKIDALNEAIKQMLTTFAQESRLRAEIQVGLITFGGEARTHLPLAAAQSITGFTSLAAQGGTPMGEAFELARALLEDQELIPSRAYRPVLILLSDGQPTDDWEEPFKALCESERAQKATRLAMSIGADADDSLLKSFANDLEAPLFKAHNARDIHRFFRAVTMSVSTRTASQAPDISTAFIVPPPDDDALDLEF
jgi:uncharacterized protein YegL